MNWYALIGVFLIFFIAMILVVEKVMPKVLDEIFGE
jgi:hypothetical protein